MRMFGLHASNARMHGADFGKKNDGRGVKCSATANAGLFRQQRKGAIPVVGRRVFLIVENARLIELVK